MRTDSEVKVHNIWLWVSLEGLTHSVSVLFRVNFVFLCNIYVKLRFEMSFPTMNLRAFVSLMEVLVNSITLIFLYGYLESVVTIVADCINCSLIITWYISQRDIGKQCKIMYTWISSVADSFPPIMDCFSLRSEKFQSILKWHSSSMLWMLTRINPNSNCLLLWVTLEALKFVQGSWPSQLQWLASALAALATSRRSSGCPV